MYAYLNFSIAYTVLRVIAIFDGGDCISTFFWHESELYFHKFFITVLNGIDESTTGGIQAQSFFVQDSIQLSG